MQSRVLTAVSFRLFLPCHDLIFVLGNYKCVLPVECVARISATVPVLKVVF